MTSATNAHRTARPGIVLYHIIRWLARLSSVVSLGLLTWFLFSGGDTPTWTEIVALAFFPGGVMLGMLLGWRREGLGGMLTLASLAAFYLWMAFIDSHPVRGPYFLLFAAPGLLFLVAWALGRRNAAR